MEGQACRSGCREVCSGEPRPALKRADLRAEEGGPLRERRLVFWARAGREEDCMGRRRQSSPDPSTSLNGNADREVGQPDSLVRAGSLQAGEDLPGGVSVPGALVGEGGGGRDVLAEPPAKISGESWEQSRGGRGLMAVSEEILITELPYFTF